MTDCQHEIVFMGMVNVNRDNYLQGVVDVWRCRKCKTLFCDDKRYGEGLKPAVGFESIPQDEEWAVLTCTTAKDVYMNSMGVKPGKKISHACRGGETREFVVGKDYSLGAESGTPIHRLYLVRDYINKNIEAGYYRLTMVK
jgi:rubredoxin